MRWEKLLFLHWRRVPSEIQSRLPAGLQVDTFQGEAWLGIVPFFMRRVRPTGLPTVPWLSDFLELNVRTYVVDTQGRPGVWFFSLACNQPIAVELARNLFGLSYVHARMSALVDNQGWCRYESHRKGTRPAVLEYRPATSGMPAEPDTLEHFLVERYLLYSQKSSGRLLCGQVNHPRYEIAPVEVGTVDFIAACADGFRDEGRPPDHSVAARNLTVKAWPVHAVT
jgi:uncharacterized protein